MIDFVGLKKETVFFMWQWIIEFSCKPPTYTHSAADCVGNDKGWITKDELRKEPLLEWGCLDNNQSVPPLTTTMTICAPKYTGGRVPPWILALKGTNLELWLTMFSKQLKGQFSRICRLEVSSTIPLVIRKPRSLHYRKITGRQMWSQLPQEVRINSLLNGLFHHYL